MSDDEQREITERPPRDNLVRAMAGEYTIRDAAEGDAPVLTGHFAVFNAWTKIDSLFEGTFMERIAPGAFTKTISENRSGMRVLFQHGMDPQLGDKPIGSIVDLREDDIGAYYEAPLFDGIPPLVLSGLRAGSYGASFRFRVVKEDFNDGAKASASNPTALPERTIREAQVFEFGPVTFPAYADATAGVRSLTDDYIAHRLAGKPALLVPTALVTGAGPAHSEEPSREPATPPAEPVIPRFASQSDWIAFLQENAR